jgi:hypothetical protein
MAQELGAFDTLVGGFIRSPAVGGLDRLAVFITQMGSAAFEIGLLLVIGGYFLFHLNHVVETVMLSVSLAGGWLLNVLLKEIFHRFPPDIVSPGPGGRLQFSQRPCHDRGGFLRDAWLLDMD